MNDFQIAFEASESVRVVGPVVRLAPHTIVFEVHNEAIVLRVSEALDRVRLVRGDQVVELGRGVLTGIVRATTGFLCEARLDVAWFGDGVSQELLGPGGRLASPEAFLNGWLAVHSINPDFKLVVADIQSFLAALSRWCQVLELNRLAEGKTGEAGGRAGAGAGSGGESERDLVLRLGDGLASVLDELFGRFESAASRVEPSRVAVHAAFAKEQLNSMLLMSPFLHRVFHKPLNYPGDYEMVNMILRDPVEGPTLYARMINRWILRHVPAVGHRNRIRYLIQSLVQQALAARARGRRLRVLNVGCGPAREVRDFIQEHEIANIVDFTLVDLNEETLRHAEADLRAAARSASRQTGLTFVRKSVTHFLRRPSGAAGDQYDFIYCAGLFDYLTDYICRELIAGFHPRLSRGGLILLTNVETGNPLRWFMDLVVDWQLIYRDAAGFLALVPSSISTDDVKVRVEGSGSNLFLEIRKNTLSM